MTPNDLAEIRERCAVYIQRWNGPVAPTWDESFLQDRDLFADTITLLAGAERLLTQKATLMEIAEIIRNCYSPIIVAIRQSCGQETADRLYDLLQPLCAWAPRPDDEHEGGLKKASMPLEDERMNTNELRKENQDLLAVLERVRQAFGACSHWHDTVCRDAQPPCAYWVLESGVKPLLGEDEN